MHFVKKTTGNESEEQRTAAEKKRAAKLRKFTEVRDLIIAKRKKGWQFANFRFFLLIYNFLKVNMTTNF